MAKRVRMGGMMATLMAVSACQAVATSPTVGPSASTPSGDLTLASSGLCLAIAALPDAAAAQRTFENMAHAALHALAAAPGLDRGTAAAVLESMQRVEGDFGTIATRKTLTADLQDLTEKADTALRAIGQSPPPCG